MEPKDPAIDHHTTGDPKQRLDPSPQSPLSPGGVSEAKRQGLEGQPRWEPREGSVP